MAKLIDLRSDTVTKPTAKMLKSMWAAPVGDDVFSEDPSINLLEQKAAAMFGMEAALFCPSGTMTNQIALKVHTQPGDEIICHEYSHIYNYEGGGIAFNSGCQVRLTFGERGLMKASEIEALINPDDVHAANTSLVVAENTCNKGGGSCYELEDLRALKKICTTNNLAFHLDGARLWNALVAKDQKPKDFGQIFDSISICLSKGLGCPVGSLLLGSKNFIKQARRIRKKIGGGMRQAGYVAAAGIFALDHHIHRLKEDHQKAQQLKLALENCNWVKSIEVVETNIVIFYLKNHKDQNDFMQVMQNHNILLVSMGNGKLRFVCHLDLSFDDISKVCNTLEMLN